MMLPSFNLGRCYPRVNLIGIGSSMLSIPKIGGRLAVLLALPYFTMTKCGKIVGMTHSSCVTNMKTSVE